MDSGEEREVKRRRMSGIDDDYPQYEYSDDEDTPESDESMRDDSSNGSGGFGGVEQEDISARKRVNIMASSHHPLLGPQASLADKSSQQHTKFCTLYAKLACNFSDTLSSLVWKSLKLLSV